MSETAPTFPVIPAAPVRVEFTYEFDDFAEASKSWAAPATRRGKAGLFGKLNRSLFGCVLFIGLAIMLFLLLQNRQSPRGARPPVPGPPANNNYLVNILLPVIPWVLIFAFIWFFVFRQIRSGRIVVESGEKPESSLFEPGTPPPPPRPVKPEPDAEARSPVVWLLVLLPLTVVAYAAYSYLRTRIDPTNAGPSGDLLEHVTLVVPWLAVVAMLWFFLPRLGGGALRATWDKQHALHRPRVLEADEQRFVLSDAVDRFEHRWEAFTHVRETAGLFLLFTAPYVFYFVPKRAFADPRELDTFRELLRRTVVHRPAPAFPVLPPAAAFPVLPAAPPPLPQPRPAQPPPAG